MRDTELTNSKKIFWIIMSVAAVAAIAAGVAVFVSKYLQSQKENEELGEYCEELEDLYYDEDEEIEDDENSQEDVQ